MNEVLQSRADSLIVPEKFPALQEETFLNILKRWREPHRRWHSEHHLESLLLAIEADIDLSETDREMLRYGALFHDAVYDPFSPTNEEDSARLAAEMLNHYSRREEVVGAILATKNHQSDNPLAQKFNQWDCAILSETEWDKLLFYEQGIAFEYQKVDRETYCRERSRFLRSAARDYQNPLLERLANEVDPR